MGLKLFSKSYISIDGSKFKAVNAKDNNFTLNKLDDRIKRLDEHIALYIEELDSCDCEEGRKLSREELQHKLNVCKALIQSELQIIGTKNFGLFSYAV